MKRRAKRSIKSGLTICLAVVIMLMAAACGGKQESGTNLTKEKQESENVVNLFGPMEKSNPNADNVARSAFDLTIIEAEKALDVTVDFRTYTAENYQEKTYDDVVLERARNDMDDWYLLNPDTIQKLGEEGKLADLSELENAENLRDVVKVSNTVNGKLAAIPQEVVVYGLFINKEMFAEYKLKLPETPDELMILTECVRQRKKNGKYVSDEIDVPPELDI